MRKCAFERGNFSKREQVALINIYKREIKKVV